MQPPLGSSPQASSSCGFALGRVGIHVLVHVLEHIASELVITTAIDTHELRANNSITGRVCHTMAVH